MKKIVIDGNKFSNLDEFFNLMGEILTDDCDEIIGHNLDAFSDLLAGGFGIHEPGETLEVEWINFGTSRKVLGYEETANYYKKKLEKNKFADNYVLQKRMELAGEHKGRTLLNMITSIITDKETGHNCELIIKE